MLEHICISIDMEDYKNYIKSIFTSTINEMKVKKEDKIPIMVIITDLLMFIGCFTIIDGTLYKAVGKDSFLPVGIALFMLFAIDIAITIYWYTRATKARWTIAKYNSQCSMLEKFNSSEWDSLIDFIALIVEDNLYKDDMLRVLCILFMDTVTVTTSNHSVTFKGTLTYDDGESYSHSVCVNISNGDNGLEFDSLVVYNAAIVNTDYSKVDHDKVTYEFKVKNNNVIRV